MVEVERLKERLLKLDSLEQALELQNDCKTTKGFVSIHDEHGKYLSTSDNISGITGYSPSELKGNSAYDYFHPTDFQAILKSHATVTIHPEISVVTYRLKKKDGSYVSVTSHSKRVSKQDGSVIIVVITHL